VSHRASSTSARPWERCSRALAQLGGDVNEHPHALSPTRLPAFKRDALARRGASGLNVRQYGVGLSYVFFERFGSLSARPTSLKKNCSPVPMGASTISSAHDSHSCRSLGLIIGPP